MKKKLIFACAIIMSASFLLGALLSFLLHFAYNPSFYVWCMRGAGVFGEGLIDEESAADAMNHMTSYLSGNAYEITVSPIYVNGAEWNFPNEHEAEHFIDVARLFRLAERVRVVCLTVFLITAAIGIIYYIKNRNAAGIGLGIAWGGFTLIAIVGIIAALASIDFYSLFYKFHQLFFTNDLWLMNPAADIIIVLMPTAFFIRFAGILALIWFIIISITTTVGFIIWKKNKHRRSYSA
jgi:integral membrane protein (TIGR01906 family)